MKCGKSCKKVLNIIKWIVIGVFIVIICKLIYTQVIEHHLQDDPMLHTLKEILKPVHPSIKNIRLYKSTCKSYTVNKDRIFLGLYDQNGEYYPKSQLVHVVLHEVAHYLNRKDIGHTEEFYRIFNELLDKAETLGVYDPSIPLIPEYTEYCQG
tara:strand:- start:307 stop:765 length:459 start_codon:yes stop_codon:yes gene_type:complete